MAGDAILYLLMYIDVSSFLIGTHLLFLAITSFQFILGCTAETLSIATYLAFASFLLILIYLTSNPIMPHVSYMIHKVPCYFCQQRSLFCAFYYPMFHIWYLDMLIILKSAFEIGLLSQNFSSKATR